MGVQDPLREPRGLRVQPEELGLGKQYLYSVHGLMKVSKFVQANFLLTLNPSTRAV